jgi:hypothetical protein
MNVIPNWTPVIAALCKMYGKRGSGGFEIYIPADVMASLLPTGQVIQLPDDPKEPGMKFRYHPNQTIEGTLVPSKEVEEAGRLESPNPAS